MKYDKIEELAVLVSAGLVSMRKHPEHDLWIYNYTKAASSFGPNDVHWQGAMSDARGLVLDNNWNVIARGFRKFWNVEQVADKMPPMSELLAVREKMDGSLGIVFGYKGRTIVATRGSFESEQAIWAQKWFDIKHPNFYPQETTFLFEIIYPKNRIVVDYAGYQGCIYLAQVDNTTGLPNLLNFHPRSEGIDQPMREAGWFGLRDIEKPIPNAEGFVLYFKNGFMAKVKFEEYCKLHRAIYQLSSRSLWEMLDPKTFDIDGFYEYRKLLPTEELRAWAMVRYHGFLKEIRRKMTWAFDTCNSITGGGPMSRKDFAAEATKHADSGLLFLAFDDKRNGVYKQAWKLSEPKHETPFRPAASDEV